MPLRPNTRKRGECPRAFTLVELLAVITIIAILAAILITAISSIRAASKKAVCASNLREIGVALRAYASERKGLLPYGRQTESPAQGQTDGSVPFWWAPFTLADALVGQNGKAGYLQHHPIAERANSWWSNFMLCPGDPNANAYKRDLGYPRSYYYRQSDIAAGQEGTGQRIRLDVFSNRIGSEHRPRWLLADRWYTAGNPRGEMNLGKKHPSGSIDGYTVSAQHHPAKGLNVLYEDGSVQWRSYPDQTLGQW